VSIYLWNEEFRIGDETIDGHHECIFALATDVLKSMGPEELAGNLMTLFRYVREHFAHEEELMRNSGYPGYRTHAAGHDKLLIELSVIIRGIGQEAYTAERLEQFINVWLLGHIVNVDTKIGRFLQQNRNIHRTYAAFIAG
jgi:hemerythrin-like metal-binding protein